MHSVPHSRWTLRVAGIFYAMELPANARLVPRYCSIDHDFSAWPGCLNSDRAVGIRGDQPAVHFEVAAVCQIGRFDARRAARPAGHASRLQSDRARQCATSTALCRASSARGRRCAVRGARTADLSASSWCRGYGSSARPRTAASIRTSRPADILKAMFSDAGLTDFLGPPSGIAARIHRAVQRDRSAVRHAADGGGGLVLLLRAHRQQAYADHRQPELGTSRTFPDATLHLGRR